MCVTCAVGEWSPGGLFCMKCSAGYSNNRFHTGCDECARGKYSREGGACHKCAAGRASNPARTACDPCAAGSVSGAGQHSCDICGAGTWSTAEQPAPCHECGDDDSIYNKYVWDPSQSGLTSNDDCKCARGRTGSNCERENCAPTTPAVSLGFLLLEVQWPRHARSLSENEAFSGISAAFRAFDANGDDFLNVTEAQTGIAAGGMAVPPNVTHIWYRQETGGVLLELPAGTVTITQMIQDQLDQLKVQQTVEYYDHPSDSGGIPSMIATYPNSGRDWDNTICAAESTKMPRLEWMVDRNETIIYQQCAFFNGVALDATTGLDKDVSSGKSNVNSNDCSTEGMDPKCSFEFNLPSGYQVKSYYPANSVEVSA